MRLNEIIGVLGMYEDITERKRAEDTLRLRESYLSAIIENQPGLLWLKDTEGRFLSVNTEFAKSCGLNNPEFWSVRLILTFGLRNWQTDTLWMMLRF